MSWGFYLFNCPVFGQNDKSTHKPQLLLDLIDTSTLMGKNLLSLNMKYGNLTFSGYMQPQFQLAAEKGIHSFNGGDFATESNNRFKLRRARLKTTFAHYLKDGRPSTYIVFQFDGTERGVRTRDFWGRYYENKWELFSLTAGIMSRPFGFEVQNSSSSRETPERGRMSQILMKSERDVGVLLNFNPRKKNSKLKWLNIDIGLYNGPGLEGTIDLDSKKDLIARVSAQSISLCRSGIELSVGVSVLTGGIAHDSEYRIITDVSGGDKPSVHYDYDYQDYQAKIAPRNYFGADFQLLFPGRRFGAEIRAEYIQGLQTAYQNDTHTPAEYEYDGMHNPLPFMTRSFNGAYFYYIQSVFSPDHQLVFKYDWYDPNTLVSGNELRWYKDFTDADVRFDTWGMGYNYYINPFVKLMIYYEHPVNEKVGIPGLNTDRKDDVFTCRMQFMF